MNPPKPYNEKGISLFLLENFPFSFSKQQINAINSMKEVNEVFVVNKGQQKFVAFVYFSFNMQFIFFPQIKKYNDIQLAFRL